MDASVETQLPTKTPPYASIKTFFSAIDYIRDDLGHEPDRVDRSVLSKLSGAGVNEVLAALRFFNLIEGDKAVPTKLFGEFVMASNEKRKPVLERMVRTAYAFVLTEAGFNIERATAAQVHEVFRKNGVSGSTLARAVTLFLALTKQAGVKISDGVKAPASSPSSKVKKEKKTVVEENNRVVDQQPPPPGVHRFELPIPGKPSVQVLVPESLDADDWETVSEMLTIYVKRWKGYADKAKATGKQEKPE